MPIPLIILGGAAIVTALGGKKAYDGYQKKSEAEDLHNRAEIRYKERKALFDKANEVSSVKLDKLGKKELQIGSEFKEFHTLAKELLQAISSVNHQEIELKIPVHKLNSIERLAISATEYLSTVVGAGASGAAAGFAVYSGVMAFAAASTGTPIAALSGAAAYNATMAAIGGGSLAAGGWGMAGGAMILGGAVVAPLILIAGWAYDSHATKALENAKEAARQSNDAIDKMDQAEAHLNRVNKYVDSIYQSLERMHGTFTTSYLVPLKAMHTRIMARHAGQITEKETDDCVALIQNGYILAAIMTSIVTTPLFEPVTDIKNKAVIKEGVIQLKTDENGINVLNSAALDKALSDADADFSGKFA